MFIQRIQIRPKHHLQRHLYKTLHRPHTSTSNSLGEELTVNSNNDSTGTERPTTTKRTTRKLNDKLLIDTNGLKNDGSTLLVSTEHKLVQGDPIRVRTRHANSLTIEHLLMAQ